MKTPTLGTCLFLGATLLGGACASRASYASYPNAPAAFDRTGSDPKALEIADKMLAAAGGADAWARARQIRWSQVVTTGGKVTFDGEEAWDRWNARHWGRLATPDGDINVGYDLYGDFSIGFVQNGKHQQKLDNATRERSVNVAKGAFNVDTAMLTIPFLAESPGATITYVGPAKDEAQVENFDDIKITFADPLRAGYDFDVIVDRTTNLPHRLEVTKNHQTVAHTLDGWTEAGGLKFPTARTNLAPGEQTIAISTIRISAPQDELFVTPMQ